MPLFGWVVIGCTALLVVEIVLIGLETRQSAFMWETYRTFEVLGAADWFALALAFAGLAYLAWFSRQALRGKILSAFMED